MKGKEGWENVSGGKSDGVIIMLSVGRRLWGVRNMMR